MFTSKKSLLLIFFLGTITSSLCEQERNADEEQRRDEPEERDVEVQKRFLPFLAGLFGKIFGK
uniref:Temporin-HB2 antimicrobial peptide n=1 Tax=Pelophylax hubeiensis TaxID=121165 RepID=A0A0A0R4U1_9NEOB|nr:temporin-HB2 antimicrobial peptide precursor [Pelophylax hubeiensis]